MPAVHVLRWSATTTEPGFPLLRRRIRSATAFAKDLGLQGKPSPWELTPDVLDLDPGPDLDASLAESMDALLAAPTPHLLVDALPDVDNERMERLASILWRAVEAGATLVTTSDGCVYQPGGPGLSRGKLLHGLIASHARQVLREARGARLRGTWDEKRAGRSILTRRIPAWLQVVDGQAGVEIKEVENRPEVVLRIFKLAAEGKGKDRIATLLNRSGTATFGEGEVWHPSYVHKILGNRAVLGEMRPMTRSDDGKPQAAANPAENYFPRVVDDALFERVAAQRKMRRKANSPLEAGESDLLRGLVRCTCGARMATVAEKRQGTAGRYLVCAGALDEVECDRLRRWEVGQVERQVIAAAVLFDFSTVLAAARTEERDARRGDLSSKLTKVVAKRSALLKAFEDEPSVARQGATMTAMVNFLKGQLAAVDEEAKEVRVRSADAVTALSRRKAAGRLLERLSEEVPDGRRLRRLVCKELRRAIGEVVVDEHSIQASYGPGFRIPGVLLLGKRPLLPIYQE